MMKRIKNTIVFLHRWLGLISGVVVLVICLTGALLVFEKEIRSFTEPFQFVKASDQPILTPGTIAKMVEKKTGKALSNISYPGPEKAVVCTLKTEKRRSQSVLAYVNPYTGQLLKVKELEKDFFKWLISGHYYLWLPTEVGKIVVPTATLVFLILLISGMFLWFPGKGSRIKQSFRIKWRAKQKRLLYDLHNVFGFYGLLLLAVLSVSGLIFGFKWFDQAFYRFTSGGAVMTEMRKPSSGPASAGAMLVHADTLFVRHMLPKIHKGHVQTLHFPAKRKDAFMLYDNPDGNTRFRRDTRYFDRYSLEELYGKGAGFYAGNFEGASLADKLKRMNYDIHVGSILGWPTKLLAFTASLIGVLLVVTGYWMWLGNRLKNRKRILKKEKAMQQETLIMQLKRISMKKSLYLSGLLLVAVFTAAKMGKNVTESGNVQLRFENLVDGKPLRLNTEQYKNAHGDDFTISAFKYYISNISLIQQSGKRIMLTESYYLLDQEKPASLQLELKGIPPGDYKGISFIIGVDSLRNLKGEQSGALDPAHKMYWSWNTGYIFLRLTGRSTKSPDGKIHFDVGGIKPETNTIRRQELAFPEMVHLIRNKTVVMEINTDVSRLFKGKEMIDFSEIYKCMGGPKAVKIADNYADGMFKIVRIKNP